MTTRIFNVALVVAMTSLSFVPGCSANIHDNTVNIDATLDFKTAVDVNNVKQGESVAVTMSTTGVVLVEPDKEPAPADVSKAAYFKIYLDDASGDPLLVTAQASVQVTIQQATPPGKHKLLCRLYKHDGTPTNQQQEINITVVASVSVNPGDAAP